MSQTVVKISLRELSQSEGVAREVLIELVEFGIAEPIEGSEAADWMFDIGTVHWIRKALRLAQDLEIDWIAVALVIDLMQEREALQQDNRRYRRQLQRFIES